MKSQPLTQPLRRSLASMPSALAAILAVLAVFWAAPVAAQGLSQAEQGVRMTRPFAQVIEITGGTGAQAWRLRYGTHPEFKVSIQFAGAEGNRAWFSHGRWLRLIDTQKGVVIGRWHFPVEIVGLVPQGKKVEVELETHEGGNQLFRQKLIFDPAAPKIPYWPHGYLLLYRVPQWEVSRALSRTPISLFGPGKMAPGQAKQFLPAVEEMARRDPLSPWFRVARGRLLREVGDPQAAAVFPEVVRVPSSHFTEMLTLSMSLDSLGEREAARETFERAYREFWQAGNDPRLLSALIARIIHYNVPWREKENVPEEFRSEILERLYRLAPYAEGADLAWPLHARYLANHGTADEARLWRTRAEETEANSSYVMDTGLFRRLDQALLVVAASALAVLFYIVVLYLHYEPQRRLDAAARKRALGPRPAVTLFSIKMWSRGERAAFFAVVVGVWLLAFGYLHVSRPSDSAVPKAIFATFYVFPLALAYVVAMYARYRQQVRAAAEQQTQPGVGDISVFDLDRWGWGRWATLLVAAFGAWLWAYLKGGDPAPFPRSFMALYAAMAAVILFLVALYVYDWPRRRRARLRAGLPGGFRCLNMEYWSRRQRAAFLVIAFCGWFAAGVAGGLIDALYRFAAAPIGFFSGGFAGTATNVYIERTLPSSAERNLLLAISYQHSGENDKAELLYRGLPDFAEAWNNLGVLFKPSGREKEAREAFEKALQLDPMLAEAELNLGRPAKTLWTQLHQKYLPGQPMLAPPRREIVERAFLGGPESSLYLKALGGPFAYRNVERIRRIVGVFDPVGGVPLAIVLRLTHVLVVLSLALGVIVLPFAPVREVTQPPRKNHWVLEALFPGTLPAWSFLGGLALVAWTLSFLQLLLLWKFRTPNIFTFVAAPNLVRHYGVQATPEDVFLLINPSWTWLYLPLLLLFAVNLALVWRTRCAAQ